MSRRELFAIDSKNSFDGHERYDPLTWEHTINHHLLQYYSEHKLPLDFDVMQSVVDYLCGDTGFRCDNMYTTNTNPALKRIAPALVGEVYENVQWDMAEVGIVLECERHRTAVWHCHIIVSVNEAGIITHAEIE